MYNGFNTVFSGVPNFDSAEDALSKFEELYDGDEWDPCKEYLQLSRFIQALFISHDGYVIDTGNYQAVNKEILRDILKNVRAHPKIWKLFMVC